MGEEFGLSNAESIVFLKSVVQHRDFPGSPRFTIERSIPIKGDVQKVMKDIGREPLSGNEAPWVGYISSVAILDKKGDVLALIHISTKYYYYTARKGRKLPDGSIIGEPGANIYEGGSKILMDWIREMTGDDKGDHPLAPQTPKEQASPTGAPDPPSNGTKSGD